jgi:hypothetical protein
MEYEYDTTITIKEEKERETKRELGRFYTLSARGPAVQTSCRGKRSCGHFVSHVTVRRLSVKMGTCPCPWGRCRALPFRAERCRRFWSCAALRNRRVSWAPSFTRAPVAALCYMKLELRPNRGVVPAESGRSRRSHFPASRPGPASPAPDPCLSPNRRYFP